MNDRMRDIETALGVSRITEVLPDLKWEMDRMKSAIEQAAMRDINENNLSAERAVSYWMQVSAINRLLKRVQVRVKLGTSAASRQAGALDIGDDDG